MSTQWPTWPSSPGSGISSAFTERGTSWGSSIIRRSCAHSTHFLPDLPCKEASWFQSDNPRASCRPGRATRVHVPSPPHQCHCPRQCKLSHGPVLRRNPCLHFPSLLKAAEPQALYPCELNDCEYVIFRSRAKTRVVARGRR